MKYKFPVINNIDDVLPSIEGRDEFIVGEREGFTFVDYVVSLIDTFPDPMKASSDEGHRLLTIRRECRGIKFDQKGLLISRVYHKFFNLGEREETLAHNIDWSSSFIIFDKLDGSFIHPLWLDREVYFCTRKGITDIAQDAMTYTQSSGIGYKAFLAFCEKEGWTPLFEWCSRKQRIVIDHPVDRLVLTGIRRKVSGEYVESFQAIAQTFGVPVVNEWEGTWKGVGRFLDDTKQLLDAEGYVIRWRDGYTAKTKGDWYCSIHRAMDSIHWEKNVVELILNKGVDDVLPNLLPADSARLESFQAAFWEGCLRTIGDVRDEVNALLDEWEDHSDEPHKIRARNQWFAGQAKKVWSGPVRGALRGLAFQIYHGQPALPHIEHSLRLQVGSGPRLDRNRALFGGIRWEDF